MTPKRLAPPPFTTRQLQYAVAVANARSFRKAAALCGVSQPSLSAQLAQLEAALGVRLFERDRRRVLPTPAGEEVVARARRLLAETDNLADAARRLGDPRTARLRLGVIPTISPYLLPRIVPALRRAQPGLVVRWTEEKTDVLVRAVEEGALEGALLALEADLGDLAREPVGRDPFVLATARAHPLGRRTSPAEMSELRGSDVLLLDDGHCLRDQALAVCAHARTHELDFGPPASRRWRRWWRRARGSRCSRVWRWPPRAVTRRWRSGRWPMRGRSGRWALLAPHLAVRADAEPDRRADSGDRRGDDDGRGAGPPPVPLSYTLQDFPYVPPSWVGRCETS